MSIAAERALLSLPPGYAPRIGRSGRLEGVPPWFPARYRAEIEGAWRSGALVRCHLCPRGPRCSGGCSAGAQGLRSEAARAPGAPRERGER